MCLQLHNSLKYIQFTIRGLIRSNENSLGWFEIFEKFNRLNRKSESNFLLQLAPIFVYPIYHTSHFVYSSGCKKSFVSWSLPYWKMSVLRWVHHLISMLKSFFQLVPLSRLMMIQYRVTHLHQEYHYHNYYSVLPYPLWELKFALSIFV